MKKLYLSGAITNNPEYKKQFTRKYRELEEKFIVLSPLFINANLEWKEYIHIDLAMIDVCDVVYMMKGWNDSRGAKIEEVYAQFKDKEIIYE